MKRSEKKGHTLLELMISMAIIAIVAALMIPKSSDSIKGAKLAGIERNCVLLKNTVAAKYIKQRYLYNTEDEIVTAIYNDILTGKDITSFVNPLNKSMVGIGLIKGNTFTDSNKAAYIFTDKPISSTIPEGVVYVVIKDKKVTANYGGNTVNPEGDFGTKY